MTSKISKKELKEPDAFISTSDHLFLWIQRHGKVMALACAAVLLMGLGWLGYSYLQSRAENQAAEALYAPEAELKKAETTVREERAKTMKDLAGPEAKAKRASQPEMVRPADFVKDYEPSVQKIKAQIKLHGDTKVALVSALNLSYFLLQQKQYSEALDVLLLPTYKPSAGDLLGGFWLMHRGLILTENQKFDEAAKSYQDVLASQVLSAFHPEAMLKLGVVYELKGEADKARQTYEKLGREFPNSEASTSAQQYLRLLELKAQQPG